MPCPLVRVTALVTAIVGLAGCDAAGSFEDFCVITCRCDDACETAQLDRCKQFGAEWEARAEDLGCAEELAAYFGCYNAHLVCRDGRAVLDDGATACADEDANLPKACNPFEP